MVAIISFLTYITVVSGVDLSNGQFAFIAINILLILVIGLFLTFWTATKNIK